MKQKIVSQNANTKRTRNTHHSKNAPLQKVADEVAKFLKLENCPSIEVKPVKRGRARIKAGMITIPAWVLKEAKIFQDYYVAHEVCHFPDNLKHGRKFKLRENEVLEKLWGVGIIRYKNHNNESPDGRKVYPIKLVELKGDRVVWSRKQS